MTAANGMHPAQPGQTGCEAPEHLRIVCCDGLGPGIFGSAHIGGEWVKTYLRADGAVASGILEFLTQLVNQPDVVISEEMRFSAERHILKLRQSRDPGSGR
ncbi:hypothetical protein [Defluviimonas salinarum]|uniref:Uncharacterized protein n=1 Tax=Defluviimonas salinarum TaxID=2992147 RepID=A0ABT3J7C2_9RHOB|nr:hypothetical protein [Defluviimonas salinarum]MCW3783586.1 hypothetical protein [Defluviimonas salinarum]